MFPWCCSLPILFPHWCFLYSVLSFLHSNIFLSCRIKQVHFNQYSSVTAVISAFSMYIWNSASKEEEQQALLCLLCNTDWFTAYSLTKHTFCIMNWSLHHLIAFVMEVLSSHFSVKNKKPGVYIAASSVSCIRLLFTRWSALHSHNEDILCYRMTRHRKGRRNRITMQMFLIDFHINT